MFKKMVYSICTLTLATMIFGSSVYASQQQNNLNNDVDNLQTDVNNGVRNVTTATDTNDDDSDWGWIGLIGLAGLLGLRRNKRENV